MFLMASGHRQCAVDNHCTADEDSTYLYRDQVHWTGRGERLAAQAIINCATNSQDGVTMTHDGVCTGTACTRGRRGDTCSVNAECDLWSCDFGAQP
jgi:phospholipase/lecithinase/hemolysin